MDRRRSAFTLLELLTVIAILALLMGILIPSLSAARQQAKANVCLSKLKGIGTAFTLYTTENKDTYPPHQIRKANPSSTYTIDYVNEYKRKWPRWHWFLETGMGPPIDPAPFMRLEAPWGDEGLGVTMNGTTLTVDLFTCPSLDDEKYSHDERSGAYGYNYQYLGNARQDNDNNQWDNFPVTNQRLKAPGRTVLIADSRGKGPKHGEDSCTLDPPRLATEQRAKRFGPEGNSDADINVFSPVELRHRKRGNVIFGDGHGEVMTLQALGYEVPIDGPNTGKVVPINPATTPTGTWSNKLWTGTGSDPMAPSETPQP